MPLPSDQERAAWQAGYDSATRLVGIASEKMAEAGSPLHAEISSISETMTEMRDRYKMLWAKKRELEAV